MEHLFALFGEPSIDISVLDKPLRREFSVPISATMLAYLPIQRTMFSQSLRSRKSPVPLTVLLDPITMILDQLSIGKEKEPIHTLTTHPSSINLIIWNTRRANNSNFRRQCESMVNLYRSAMLVLLETKMVELKCLTNALGYDAQVQSPVVGLSGGIIVI